MKRIYDVITIREYGINSLAQTILKKTQEYQSQGYEVNIHTQTVPSSRHGEYIAILEIYKERL